MSFGYADARQLTSKTLSTNDPTWVRPSEWISLPSVGATEQKLSGLYAVYPDDNNNYVALTCNGNYTVDWGDGTVENFNSATQANHQYTYASVGNSTSYGYKQVIITVTPQSGQNLTVINIRNKHPNIGSNANYVGKWLDIEVGSPNLSALTIGANNQQIILSLLQRVRLVSKSTSYTSLTDFFYWCMALQQVILDCDMSNVVSLSAFFYQCTSLRYPPYFNTSSCTNMGYMFGQCYELISVPNYNTSKVTDMNNMFSNCYKLKQAPIFDTANVTTFASTFNNCYNLQNVPPLNAIKATTFNGMFQNCKTLTSITISNVGNSNSFTNLANQCSALTSISITGNNVNGTSITADNMLRECANLKNITLPNLYKCNNFSSFFQNCISLVNSPVINTSNATNMSAMYQSCANLVSPDETMDTSKCTNFNSMFNGCLNLKIAPNYNLNAATTISSMYSGCPNIFTIPAYNLANITVNQGTFLQTGLNFNSATLVSSNITNLKFTTTYANCAIQKTGLETIFTNMGNAGAAAQSINITGNPGADTALSKTATWTNTSNVMTMANTVGVSVGAQITGANIANALAITVNANNTITASTYIDNATYIAFANVTTTNLIANTRYWTSNRVDLGGGSYTYELASSNGGSSLTFTSGTANMLVNRIVTTVNTNSNVILSAWPSGNGTAATATTRVLNTNIGLFKGFTITG